jgi:hypothetical protein
VRGSAGAHTHENATVHIWSPSRLCLRNVTGGVVWLKEYECVQVEHHKDVGKTIGEYESRGWSLRSYQAAGTGAWMQINHYLLFERG